MREADRVPPFVTHRARQLRGRRHVRRIEHHVGVDERQAAAPFDSYHAYVAPEMPMSGFCHPITLMPSGPPAASVFGTAVVSPS